MKYTFYIEGGDNVGKTTTINYLKKHNNLTNQYKTIYSKYPTSNMTEYMNIYNKYIQYIPKNTLYSKEIILNTILNSMYLLIDDMKDSLISSKDNIIQICDRGVLSTFLYQFLKYDNIKSSINLDTKIKLEDFFTDMMTDHTVNINIEDSYMTDKSIIILYNNKKNNKLIIDESETIDYKKAFDQDTNLQNIINSSIDDIVYNIDFFKKHNDCFKIYNFKFYYINIYDNNDYRKSTEVISNEIINIIQNTINQEETE